MSQAAADPPLLAGVELGGTKCICILGIGPDDVRETVEIATTGPDETLAAIAAVLAGWSGFAALGIGGFGPLQLDTAAPDWGSILSTPKPGWAGVALARRLAGGLRVPLGFDTDVAGAALAEGRWGAARGLANHAYVTIGTGIGVGIVVNGKPVAGLGHPEAGHMRVPRVAGDDWPGSCPLHGDCVEGLASGSAIAARTGVDIATLAPDDPAWALAANAIAAMLHNLVLTTAPIRIVIGGGVPGRQPRLLLLIRRRLVESLAGYAQGARIAAAVDDFVVAPALGGRAGPLGALALAADALAHGATNRPPDHCSPERKEQHHG